MPFEQGAIRGRPRRLGVGASESGLGDLEQPFEIRSLIASCNSLAVTSSSTSGRSNSIMVTSEVYRPVCAAPACAEGRQNGLETSAMVH